jgi:hypothetical protein
MGRHVEERLLQRVPPATGELAVELLRDPRALRTRVAAWFKQLGQEVPPRVALPLRPSPGCPHLVVSRDGHGVTCLGEGMAFHGPALPFAVVGAFLSRQQRRQRVSMALSRLGALDQEGFSLPHFFRYPWRCSRAQFDILRVAAPFLLEPVDQAVNTVSKQCLTNLARSARTSKLPGDAAEALWGLVSFAATGLMVVGWEPGAGKTLQLAAATADTHICQRAVWLLVNQPAVLLERVADLGRDKPGLTYRVLGPLLAIVARRFRGFRAAAEEAFRDVEARTAPRLEAPPWSLPLQDDPDSRWLVEGTLLAHMLEAMWDDWPYRVKQLLSSPAGQDLTLPPVEVGTWSWRQRAYSVDPAVGQRWDLLDLWRDMDRLPSPSPAPLAQLSPADQARVAAWRVLLDRQTDPVRQQVRSWFQVLSLAPQEALVPDQVPSRDWSLSVGPVVLQCVFSPSRRSPREPLRRENTSRPNDPCPCGSGKKHKRCCGAVGAGR